MSPSRSETRSRSQSWLGKRSIEARTCFPTYGAIEGRIRALANVHSLFVQTRWIGAELSAIATQELAPYSGKDEARVRIDGPQVLLEPTAAQTVAVTLHELATNAAKYGAFPATKAGSNCNGPTRTGGCAFAGPRRVVPWCRYRRAGALAAG